MFNASRAMVRPINTSRTATSAAKNCSCSGGGAKPQANPARTYGVRRLRPTGVTVTRRATPTAPLGVVGRGGPQGIGPAIPTGGSSRSVSHSRFCFHPGSDGSPGTWTLC